MDPLRQVGAWFHAVSHGRLNVLPLTANNGSRYEAVVLRRPTPAHGSAAANVAAFCPGGSGAGFHDIANDALDQLAHRGTTTTAAAAPSPCASEPSRYDLYAFVFPYVQGCSGAVAQTPGRFSWYNGYSPAAGGGGIVALRTLRHELGHNLGLQHAKFIGSNGAETEYGDVSDVMGKGATHVNAAYQHALDWLTDEDVLLVRRSGVYRVYAADYGAAFDADGLPAAAASPPRVTYTAANRLRALALQKDGAASRGSMADTHGELYYAWYRSRP